MSLVYITSVLYLLTGATRVLHDFLHQESTSPDYVRHPNTVIVLLSIVAWPMPAVFRLVSQFRRMPLRHVLTFYGVPICYGMMMYAAVSRGTVRVLADDGPTLTKVVKLFLMVLVCCGTVWWLKSRHLRITRKTMKLF